MITRSALKRSLGSSSHGNNQQPHQPAGKIQKKNSFKDDDKKKKSKLAEGKPRKQRRRNDFPRLLNGRERADYNDRVKVSGGFDVGNVPDNIDIRDMEIRPFPILDLLPDPSAIEYLKELEEHSKLALAKYNNDNETNYQFAKFLKANYCGGYVMDYYITFQAKRMAGSLPKNFQALVRIIFRREPEVLLCRQA